MDKITLTIDDKQVEVNAGATVLEAIKEADIYTKILTQLSGVELAYYLLNREKFTILSDTKILSEWSRVCVTPIIIFENLLQEYLSFQQISFTRPAV